MDSKVKAFYQDQVDFFTAKAKKAKKDLEGVTRIGLPASELDKAKAEFYTHVAELAKVHLEK